MVITVQSNISEISINEIINEAEIFTMNACHEIELAFVRKGFLNESGGLMIKLKSFLSSIKNRIIELYKRTSQKINDLIADSKYIRVNTKLHNLRKLDGNSEIDKIIKDVVTEYIMKHDNIYNIHKLDLGTEDFATDKIISVSDYMDKAREYVDTNNKNELIDAYIAVMHFNYTGLSDAGVAILSNLSDIQRSILTTLRNAEKNVRSNSSSIDEEEYKEIMIMARNAMNCYLAAIKCNISVPSHLNKIADIIIKELKSYNFEDKNKDSNDKNSNSNKE